MAADQARPEPCRGSIDRSVETGGGDTVASPSAWVARWAARLAPGSEVLDLACGRGRHLKMLSDLGHRVTAVDREVGPARVHGGDRVVLVEADLEAAPWPFPGRLFDAVVVTNYLWRPLLPTLIGSVAAGGLLIYETFMQGQEHYGRPSNPDYLLRPGELRAAVAGELDVVAFEQGPEGDPVTGFRQRICARRAAASRPT